MERVKKLRPVTTLPAQARDDRQGHRIGRITGLDQRGWLVECGMSGGEMPARTTLALDAAAMQAAANERREVLLVLTAEPDPQPIVIGLLAPPPAPASQPAPLDAVVDGQRVVVEGKDEIVLRCGAASITLRRNGRVVIRGVYVETRSRGLNRIKGGSVQIN